MTKTHEGKLPMWTSACCNSKQNNSPTKSQLKPEILFFSQNVTKTISWNYLITISVNSHCVLFFYLKKEMCLALCIAQLHTVAEHIASDKGCKYIENLLCWITNMKQTIEQSTSLSNTNRCLRYSVTLSKPLNRHFICCDERIIKNDNWGTPLNEIVLSSTVKNNWNYIL